MHCVHCKNPNAANVEVDTKRVFCNVDCQRAMYTDRGIFDIVATRKHTISRDIVFRLVKELATSNGKYEKQSLPKIIVQQLGIMHKERVPFAEDHVQKVYDWFFHTDNAEAVRHTFKYHQDMLKQECVHNCLLVQPTHSEIFIQLYKRGGYITKDLPRVINIWFRNGYHYLDVIAVILKDDIMTESDEVFNALLKGIEERGLLLFRDIIDKHQLSVNIVLQWFKYNIKNWKIDFNYRGVVDLTDYRNIFVRDPRIIPLINSQTAGEIFQMTMQKYFEFDIELAKYVLLNLSPDKRMVTEMTVQYVKFVEESRRLEEYNRLTPQIMHILKEILSTYKVDFDDVPLYEFGVDMYTLLQSYVRAQKRAGGESARKYNKMGKLIQ